MSGFLILNTVTTLVAEQTAIIGTMKAVGGTRGAIMRGYLVSVGIYSVLATLPAIVLGLFGGYELGSFLATSVPIDIGPFVLQWWIVIVGLAVGFGVPHPRGAAAAVERHAHQRARCPRRLWRERRQRQRGDGASGPAPDMGLADGVAGAARRLSQALACRPHAADPDAGRGKLPGSADRQRVGRVLPSALSTPISPPISRWAPISRSRSRNSAAQLSTVGNVQRVERFWH